MGCWWRAVAVIKSTTIEARQRTDTYDGKLCVLEVFGPVADKETGRWMYRYRATVKRTGEQLEKWHHRRYGPNDAEWKQVGAWVRSLA